jgi:hypothetical protein
LICRLRAATAFAGMLLVFSTAASAAAIACSKIFQRERH